MAVWASLLCRPKYIQENVFDNIKKENIECVPENTNCTLIYTVSMK